jgi:Zn-dependent M28 family amino/carboxypeptidase
MCKLLSIWIALSLLYGCTTTHVSPVQTITAQNILSDVQWLASDELQGRYFRSQEARNAATYIATKWKHAGLVPLAGKTSMFLPTDDLRDAPNVAAMLQGTGKSYVLLIAHYDHLKPRTTGEDRIYNGADDNASGTAALIAIAEALGQVETPPIASIVVVAFTGEEAGFVGSRHFTKSEPIQLQNIQAVINLDMISRGDSNTIFLEGASDAPRISQAISKANKTVGLTIIRDKHPDWLRRSDQWPFLQQGVPAVFLSVEDHEDYHRVTDHADKILPDLAAKTTRLAFLAALDLARHVP